MRKAPSILSGGRGLVVGSIAIGLVASATLLVNRPPTSPVNDHPLVDNRTSRERYEELLPGTWEDDYMGHRTVTFRPDGTATMIVELEGLSATLFADRLTFEEEWRIEGGRLVLRAVSGEPAARTELILRLMGDTTEQEILELTGDRLLLLDADGEKRYDWRRVGRESSDRR